MHSPDEEDLCIGDLCVDDKRRFVLHEFYAAQIPLMERKLERMCEYLKALRSPNVEYEELEKNTLIGEDGLQRLLDDCDLLVFAMPERVRRVVSRWRA